MIQVKRFDLIDVDGFNNFIKTVSLAGDQPIKYNENSFFVFYEEGKKFDKKNKLKALNKSLEEAEVQLLSYQQQALMQEAMMTEYMARPDSEANAYEKRKFKEENDTALNAKNKMVELETIKVKVIEKMIADLEKENE